MGKFKKGDRVKLLDCGNVQAEHGLKVGSVGTINENHSTCPYVVYDDVGGLVATNEERLELLPVAEATAMTQDEISKAREIPGIKSNTTTRTPLTIEAGKYYRTRDGRKVLVRENEHASVDFPWTHDCGYGSYHALDMCGKSCVNSDEADLIAEWVDEPAEEVTAVEPTDDNAPPVAVTDPRRFKIGDKVRALVDYLWVNAEQEYDITYIDSDGDVWLKQDGREAYMIDDELELIAPAEETLKDTSADGRIVMDVTNGVLTMGAANIGELTIEAAEITEAIKSTLLRTKQGCL